MTSRLSEPGGDEWSRVDASAQEDAGKSSLAVDRTIQAPFIFLRVCPCLRNKFKFPVERRVFCTRGPPY
ncbi:unnamed protein product [Lota lota]